VSSITAQNPGYNQFPLAENGWGTINPAPDMAPSLHTEEGGGGLHGCMNRVGFRWENLFFALYLCCLFCLCGCARSSFGPWFVTGF
jgi:hypothetical protein